MIDKEKINYSLRNIKNRKTRSLLTILSITAGVATIFIFISFGLGLYSYVNEVFSSSAVDKLMIQPKGTTPLDTSFYFDQEDLESVEKSSGVESATGVSFRSVEVKKSDKLYYTYLIGFDPKNMLMMEVTGLKLAQGRQPNANERAAVVGYNYLLENKIFEKPYSLNENILINGEKIKIVGFYNSIGNPADDAQIYISLSLMKDLFSINDTYNMIVAQVDLSRMNETILNIEKNLRQSRNIEKGKEDFYVQSFENMIESYSTVLNIVIGFILLIALISIIVSSINTANTMVTSVLERRKEIGIMKSIGAKNSDVFFIFVFESGFLGAIAGIIGMLIGLGLSSLGANILNELGYGFLKPSFPPVLFIGCLLFSILTGAISGLIPSVNASKTNPVQTLNYE